MKRAIIVGSNGQDGSYLFEYLHKKKYEIIGIGKGNIRSNLPKSIKPIDISDSGEIYSLVDDYKPDEIYYLASFQQSSEELFFDDVQLFKKSLDVNLLSLINFLEGIRKYSRSSKLFYAASSHIWGNPVESIQDELTPINPNCIYGITKASGLLTCRFYRVNHSIFASVGILYNHESSIRSSRYISKKIVSAAVAIKNKEQDKLTLGDLNSKVDWGYAPDYVEAMFRILQLSSADDFVISSGSTHTVLDFVKSVFRYLDLDWTKYVEENPDLITKRRKSSLQGNSQKLRSMTGWRPKVSFDKMIEILVREERDLYGKR